MAIIKFHTDNAWGMIKAERVSSIPKFLTDQIAGDQTATKKEGKDKESHNHIAPIEVSTRKRVGCDQRHGNIYVVPTTV